MPRGQKTCPKCKFTTGPRSQECPNCEYKFFVSKEEKEQEILQEETDKLKELREKYPGYRGGDIVFTPGKSPSSKEPFLPVPLKGFSQKDVNEWVDKLQGYAYKNNMYYTPEAIRYFAHFDLNRNDLNKMIDEAFSNLGS